MNDTSYIEAYKKYREELNKSDFNEELQIISYNTIEKPKSNEGIIFLYSELLSEHIRQLSNDINSFRRNLIKLNAWNIVIKDYKEDIKFDLFLEFIEPLVVLLHDFPYSIKNRFIFSLSHLCHQANRYVVDNWKDDLVNDKDVDFKSMKNKCSRWKYFEELLLVLSDIFGTEYNNKTNNYRNMSHHRIPINTEMGLSNLIARNKDENGKVSYSYGDVEPISIEDTIDIMKEEHLKMCNSFSIYEKLLQHQVDTIDKKLMKE